MIAGEDHGGAFQIKFPEQRPNEAREQRQHSPRLGAVLRVTDLVGDEVFVKREAIRTGDVGQDCAGFFRRAQVNFLAALNQSFVQQLVRKIVKDRGARSQPSALILARGREGAHLVDTANGDEASQFILFVHEQ